MILTGHSCDDTKWLSGNVTAEWRLNCISNLFDSKAQNHIYEITNVPSKMRRVDHSILFKDQFQFLWLPQATATTTREQSTYGSKIQSNPITQSRDLAKTDPILFPSPCAVCNLKNLLLPALNDQTTPS